MDHNEKKLIKALTSLNISLLTALETALSAMKKWDDMPDNKKKDIISSLKLLVENNKRAYLFEKPTLH